MTVSSRPRGDARILVVEDNDTLRRGVAMALRETWSEVTESATLQYYDLCVSAGSLKDLIAENTKDYFLRQIECSRKLHNSQTVILTMHQDCGAYGGTANFEDAEDEFRHYQKVMDEAEKIVLQKFPKANVVKYFIQS